MNYTYRGMICQERNVMKKPAQLNTAPVFSFYLPILFMLSNVYMDKPALVFNLYSPSAAACDYIYKYTPEFSPS